MPGFQQTKYCKRKKQSENTKNTSEPDLDIPEVLELSDQEFKVTMVNLLGTLVRKNGQYTRTDV